MGAETLKSIDELVDQVVQLKTKYPTEFERTQQKVKDEFNERYERESARWGDRHALFKMGVDDALDGVYIEWMLITARFLSFLKDIKFSILSSSSIEVFSSSTSRLISSRVCRIFFLFSIKI